MHDVAAEIMSQYGITCFDVTVKHTPPYTNAVVGVPVASVDVRTPTVEVIFYLHLIRAISNSNICNVYWTHGKPTKGTLLNVAITLRPFFDALAVLIALPET